jgi:uncharacterized protein YbjT (DUF2867 family)
MKAFCTGATGFIGGHLVYRLIERCYSVTALVRTEKDAEKMHVFCLSWFPSVSVLQKLLTIDKSYRLTRLCAMFANRLYE